MKLARLAFVILTAAWLGGCATTDFGKVIGAVGGFTIAQSQVDAARSTYDGTILVPLKKYAQLRRCLTGEAFTITNPCHDRKLLKQIRQADMAVADAIDQTQDMVTSGNNTGAVAAYNTLKNAIVTAQRLLTAAGASNL